MERTFNHRVVEAWNGSWVVVERKGITHSFVLFHQADAAAKQLSIDEPGTFIVQSWLGGRWSPVGVWRNGFVEGND